VALDLSDDGRGLPAGAGPAGFGRNGHMGLAGMRERIGALGGTVLVERADGGGVRLAVRLPLGAGIAP
jgi:signal transduction histidine kinase